MEETKRRQSSLSATGLLLVCISLFVWLVIDTLIAAIPPSEVVKVDKFHNPNLVNAYPGAENQHLWWIIQISDIHISSFRNFHIPGDFELFLKEVIPTVKPLAVLATGDLTDGKKTNILHSSQEPSEWQKYRNLLEEHFLGDNEVGSEQVTWIDMRGNHDKFDVPSHSDDFYNKFSPFSRRWKAEERHTVHRFTVNNTPYAIVATDATPNPGFRRPYNFFGILTEPALNDLQIIDSKLAKEGVQLAIWSGHYTTSTIFMGTTFSSDRKLIGDVIRHGAVYLCGHLHTLHDAEMALYARHSPLGQLELELADFQRARRFRIVAVDHGLLSFTDVSMQQWPIVLVVNPKEALYAMPNHEPLEKIAKSTHIRILAFSTAPIISVQVALNGHFLGNATRNSHALYTLPWSPQELVEAGSLFHRLDVTVVDAEGRKTSESVTFFVNHEEAVPQLPANIGGPFASFILLWNIPKMCRNAFVASSLFCIVLLMAARFQPNVFRKITPNWRLVHGFVSFANLPNLLFITILFAVAYPIFGPWLLGEVLTGRFALIFAHGNLLVDDGTFIPCGVVAFHGFQNVLSFYLLLLLYFAWLFSSAPATRSRTCRVTQRVFFQFIILYQLWSAYWDASAYGFLAFALSPMRTWSSLLFIYIDTQVRNHLMHGR